MDSGHESAAVQADDYTGYLDVALAPAYEPPPPGSQTHATVVGYTAEDPAATAGPPIPSAFTLHENVPNPFNPATAIRFDLPRSSRVRVQVHDAQGRLVQTLVDDSVPPGSHEVWWRGRGEGGESVPAGIYFVTMEAENTRQTRKVTLLK